MKKPVKKSPRLMAVHTLGNVLDRQQNLNDADVSGQLSDPRDRAMSRHLSYGVLRWLTGLQWISGKLMDRPLKSRDRDINRLIWIGLFQLWKGGTSQHAAINETAECARSLGKPWAVGLINAILRRFQREQEQVIANLQQVDARFGHPDWLLKTLQADWPDEWEAITTANNTAAPLWLRLNRAKSGQGDIEKSLNEAGFDVQWHPYATDALSLTPAAPVSDIPGFKQGILSVQDPAAQLAVDLLDLQPGQRVLDACAAPGGKTGHILERESALELTIVELSNARMDRIKENLERLGLSGHKGISLLTADAAETEKWWDGQPYDRILLDAPCTATGVIRRHPEIKWLRSREQVRDALKTQQKLLQQLWSVLKPGGMLVYATCSVLVTENRKQVEQFLSSREDARAVPLQSEWGRSSGDGRQILPGEEGMDGFFYACLRKTC